MRYRLLASILLFIALLTCFTFNAIAADMPFLTNSPEITIDGNGDEFIWMESSRATFSDCGDIADTIGMDVIGHQNAVYGLVNLTDVSENAHNLILRVDYSYEDETAYVIFVFADQSVICSNDDDVKGAIVNISNSYYAEFSFIPDYSGFKQGDFVRLKVRVGDATDIDDYNSVQVFELSDTFDYYLGGKLPDKVSSSKPQSSGSSSTKKTTKPSNKTTVAEVTTTKYDLSQFIEYGYMDSVETTVIITLMAIICFVGVIVIVMYRRPNKDSQHDYTDDDRGCD